MVILGKIVGILFAIGGLGLAASTWASFHAYRDQAILASAVQVSQVAAEAQVEMLFGIILVLFGMTLIVLTTRVVAGVLDEQP